MREKQNIFRGCLLGLAVGDAMGYTVDSRSLQQIHEDYGPNGLLGYDLVNGYADVTSYTQVAAFTANALLLGLTRGQMQGRMAPPVRYIGLALREWSRSQQYSAPQRNFCWLSGVPEMKRRHCMDTRMLDALSREALGTMEEPVTRSQKPSALTEAVPVAMLGGLLGMDDAECCRLGAEAAALTHGDPEAFLANAAFTHGLRRVLARDFGAPGELVQETIDNLQLQFGREYAQTTHIFELLQLSMTLAQTDGISPEEAMERLGCRTAAEVLAGALYACMTCGGDFDAAMITAVNHSGRSAAVGAVTGALVGAVLGEQSLPDFYLDCLEPTPYLRQLADDMAQGCPMDQVRNLFDDDWDRKYLHGEP